MPGPRRIGNGLGLLATLYAFIMSVDALRKTFGISGSSVAIVYVLTAAIYFCVFSNPDRRRGLLPGYLPISLLCLTIWCCINALVQGISAPLAILGWSSYVFFVPLAYVGAELMADDGRAVKVMRVAAVMGAVIGIGTILSAILGSSAPALLQPITPSVGVHTANGGNIYLAPSIFADSEEASEQLLVSLLAWAALMLSEFETIRRRRYAVIGLAIFIGLIAAERRAAIDVAVLGLLALIASGARIHKAAIGRAHRPISAARRRQQLALVLVLAAVGSFTLISALGAKVIVTFLTSDAFGAPLRLMVSYSDPTALYGQGPGTSTQGANLIGATSFTGTNALGTYTGLAMDGRSFLTAEGGLAKTWLELGLVGVLLYAAVFVTLIGPPLRFFRMLDSTGRSLLVLVLGLGILFLKGHQSLDDPLIQPLFWIAAGGIWGRLRRRSTDAPVPQMRAGVRAETNRATLSAASG